MSMSNSAPEKIYCGNNGHGNLSYSNQQFPNAVEYTRTDAFIEKACEWFRKIDYDDSIPPFETTEEFIEGFKQAMKDE